MFELLKYSFMQNALITCVIASIICGIIGTIVIEKKMMMLTGGISHTAFGGVGLGYLLGFNPMIGAAAFSVLAALGIGVAKKKDKINSDIFISLFWSLGMALGILFIGISSGVNTNISSYLFGSILTVLRVEVIYICIICFIILGLFLMFYNDLKIYMFDSEFAKTIGLKTNLLENVTLILIALSIVVLIRSVGIILLMAMLTAPAATAKLISKKLNHRIIISVILGIIYSLFGIFLSVLLDIPSGATIVILSVVIFFIVLLVKNLNKKFLYKERNI